MFEENLTPDNQASEPKAVDAAPISFEFSMSVPEVTLIRADSIKVEPSSKPRYLPLKSGDVQVYSTVQISVSGKWFELTKDSSPEFEAEVPTSSD